MEHTTESKERDALYAQLQNEAASLYTIHEMLGSGRWTMDFDESGAMTRVDWSDEFRRMLGYQDQEDFPDALESWSDLLHPDDKEHVLREFNETMEIGSLCGNVTRRDGEVYIHLHVTLCDVNAAVHGGHAKELHCSATCEMFVRTLPGEVGRRFDEETGLNLFRF